MRHIFQDYLEGRACQPIADNLNLEGIPTRNGGAWNGSRVWSILTSHTYIGEGQHCRVRYTKRDDGEREVRQGQIGDSHEGILVVAADIY